MFCNHAAPKGCLGFMNHRWPRWLQLALLASDLLVVMSSAQVDCSSHSSCHFLYFIRSIVFCLDICFDIDDVFLHVYSLLKILESAVILAAKLLSYSFM